MADEVLAAGWKDDVQSQDENGRIVSLIHVDTATHERMAVFDVLINNADREGEHVLAMPDGHRYGVDHSSPPQRTQLRTVLWGWTGDALGVEERAGIDGCSFEGLPGELGRHPAELLTAEETASIAAGCARLPKTR